MKAKVSLKLTLGPEMIEHRDPERTCIPLLKHYYALMNQSREIRRF